jgi:uncharacterized protein YidB (DUF937 family)
MKHLDTGVLLAWLVTWAIIELRDPSGLGELIERFKENGHADAAGSWVNEGPDRASARRSGEANVFLMPRLLLRP